MLLCSVADSNALMAVSTHNEMMLPTGHLTLLGPVGSLRARSLLDSNSERSYITEEYAEKLKLIPVGSEKFFLHRFEEASPQLRKFNVVEFEAKAKHGRAVKFNALIVPQITGKAPDTPSNKVRKMLSNPAEHPGGPKQIGVLFCFADMVKIVNGGFRRIKNCLSSLSTIFGEIPVSDSPTKVMSKNSLLINIEKFWDLEHIGIIPEEESATKPNETSEQCVENFLKTVSFDGKMYSTTLNLDPHKVEYLSNNYQSAKKQLLNLLKSFEEKLELDDRYVEQMEVFFENNFAKLLPPGQEPKYFMPHFPVMNESKETYKVRPVFNASSKMKGQLSLNEVIIDVPNVLPTPVEVLTKFRTHTVALSGDITKAYLTVGIHESLRNYQCFLWTRDKNPTNIKTYRMSRNCFGLKDAQFSVITVIRNHATKYKASNPGAFKAITGDLYMDDLISGGNQLKK